MLNRISEELEMGSCGKDTFKNIRMKKLLDLAELDLNKLMIKYSILVFKNISTYYVNQRFFR